MSQPQGQENLVMWARPLLTSQEGIEQLVDPSLGGNYNFDNLARVAAIASMCVHPEVTQRPFMGEVVQALKLIYNDGGEACVDWNKRSICGHALEWSGCQKQCQMGIAVWDANLVTPHKRMGNVGISLESLCDGKMHDVLVELEGIGGGGKIYLEVRYKSFDEIAKEKEWWKIPFISEFLMRSSLGSALNAVIGSDGIQAREFVQAAFGQLRSFSFPQVQMGGSSNDDRFDMGGADMSLNTVQDSDLSQQDRSLESSERNLNSKNEYESQEFFTENNSFSADNGENPDKSEDYFWKNFADNINQTIYKKLGFSLPEVTRWDGFDLLNNLALQSQRSAESEYIESGLVTPRNTNDEATINGTPPRTNGIESSISDIKMTSRNVLNQTEAILGALMVLAATLSKTTKDARTLIMNEDKNVASDMEVDDGIGYYSSEEEGGSPEAMAVDNKNTDEMRSLFLTAESAMEAWAMLATSLGRPSFIKSEFTKICFIDNVSTDTQVAIWRDSVQRRLVVAFRGTEQMESFNYRLNPERLGGDFKQEVQVHSGFLGAYDSVRIRIMTLVKTSIGFCEDNLETGPKWHVYVTGHSLGGALATLLALELSSSQMAKCGAIYVTMYNFGSPRVGNKKFAEVYNEKVKDSWRIVNHRDIIPTVPRLMGYCHVAQPVYLAAGDLKDSLAKVELLEDGYQGDIIGEATPDVIVNEFMKGEREFIDKILQTEINIFLSIRDGSALMQHMEDFYYITLLEKVRSNYRVMNNSNANEADAFSA
ncbi:Receptor-like serine/threonine-protein kinase ALE2 [Acorus calamus]|uniref:Receptor-like serine/threonine-protein kinase ALE2 n=1 Tax=Acorus calamus TaxID=4465 RepID=A0AAV9EN26_ACOCL|nr:Receptor-like serine/threonine-protein kinase ALE2 [Acorus calamus]